MGGFAVRGTLLAAALLMFMLASSGQALATHVGCGTVITQDTTLDSDIADCPYDGIIIGAANITLDLNGHTIDGDSKLHICCFAGVRNDSGFTGIEVANGTIQEFNGDGISASNTANSTIRNLTLQFNFGDGIRLFASQDNMIERNVVTGNVGFGMSVGGPFDERGLCTTLLASARNRIERNTVSQHGGSGIAVGCSSDTLIRGNDLTQNGEGGGSAITVGGGVNSRIESNRVVDNPLYGIVLHEAERNSVVEHNIVHGSYAGILLEPAALSGKQTRDNLVTQNFVRNNRAVGILISDTGPNLVERNDVWQNGSDGSFIASGLFVSGNGNQIVDNFARDNQHHGVFLYNAVNTRVAGNKAYRNTDDGIHVESDGGNTIATNAVNQNGDLGIEAPPSVIDGGGNKAAGNGNPLQCLNVACK